MPAGEHLREGREKRDLSAPRQQHDVEQAVVGLRRWREAHPAAVVGRVRRRHRPADHFARRAAVDLHGEPDGFPPGGRAQCPIGVDLLAANEPGTIGDHLDVRVEADTGNAEVGPAVRLG